MDECRFEQLRQGHGCGHRGLGQELHVIDDNVYWNSFVKVTDVVIEALTKLCHGFQCRVEGLLPEGDGQLPLLHRSAYHR